MTKSIVIGDLNLTGYNEIDIPLVIKSWNHLWTISEYFGTSPSEYRLVKYKRKDSPLRDYKLDLTEKQAKEIIDSLNLNFEESYVFRNYRTWKK